jgi:hypothetical protein
MQVVHAVLEIQGGVQVTGPGPDHADIHFLRSEQGISGLLFYFLFKNHQLYFFTSFHPQRHLALCTVFSDADQKFGAALDGHLLVPNEF